MAGRSPRKLRWLFVAAVAFGALALLRRLPVAVDGFERHVERASLGGAALDSGTFTVAAERIDVLVLDDHPVAFAVAERLASELRRRLTAIGCEVRVHAVAQAPLVLHAPADADVLALVDRVHTVQDDFGLFQTLQVRLNVALGRPPRALEGTREEGEFHLEYSIDAHFDQLFGGPRHAELRAAERIELALLGLLDRVQWSEHDGAAAPRLPVGGADLPSWLPQGERQVLYDIVRRSGVRERAVQLDTALDWRSALGASEAAALAEGWAVVHRVDEPCREAVALVKDGVRVELCLAYMQQIPRATKEQRQVLTVLVRGG